MCDVTNQNLMVLILILMLQDVATHSDELKKSSRFVFNSLVKLESAHNTRTSTTKGNMLGYFGHKIISKPARESRIVH